MLFEKVAWKLEDDVEEYDESGFWVSDSPLAEYMTNYEDVVNDETVKYYNRKDNEERDLKFWLC